MFFGTTFTFAVNYSIIVSVHLLHHPFKVLFSHPNLHDVAEISCSQESSAIPFKDPDVKYKRNNYIGCISMRSKPYLYYADNLTLKSFCNIFMFCLFSVQLRLLGFINLIFFLIILIIKFDVSKSIKIIFKDKSEINSYYNLYKNKLEGCEISIYYEENSF